MQRRRIETKRVTRRPTWAETTERRLGLMDRVATGDDAEIDAWLARMPAEDKRRLVLHYISCGSDPRPLLEVEAAISDAAFVGAATGAVAIAPSLSSTASRSAIRVRHAPLPRLPRALWQLVLQNLVFGDMTAAHLVSRACRALVRDPASWSVLRVATANQVKWLARFAPDLTRCVRALDVCAPVATRDDDGDEPERDDDRSHSDTPAPPRASAVNVIARQIADDAGFFALRALHVSGDFLQLYRVKTPEAEATALRAPGLAERLESLRAGVGYVMVACEFRLVGLVAPRLESLRVDSLSDREDDAQYWVDLHELLADSVPALVELRLSHVNRSANETEPYATGPYVLNADQRRNRVQTNLNSCVIVGWRYWCEQSSDALYDTSCATTTLAADGPLFAWPPSLTSLSLTYEQLTRNVEWSTADVDALSRLPIVQLSLFVRPWWNLTIVPDWLLLSAPRRLVKIVLNCDMANKRMDQNGGALVEWMSDMPELAVVAIREIAPTGHSHYPLLDAISAAVVRDRRKFPRLRQLHACSDFMRRCRCSDAIVCDAWCVCAPDGEIHSVGFAPLSGAAKRRAVEYDVGRNDGDGGDDETDGDLHFAIPRGYRCVRFRVGVANRELARLIAMRDCIVTATVTHEFDGNLYATPLAAGACYYASLSRLHADALVPGPVDDALPLLSSPYHEERDRPQPCYCAAPRLERWRSQALSRYDCLSPACGPLHDGHSTPEDVSSDTSYHIGQLIHLFATGAATLLGSADVTDE